MHIICNMLQNKGQVTQLSSELSTAKSALAETRKQRDEMNSKAVMLFFRVHAYISNGITLTYPPSHAAHFLDAMSALDELEQAAMAEFSAKNQNRGLKSVDSNNQTGVEGGAEHGQEEPVEALQLGARQRAHDNDDETDKNDNNYEDNDRNSAHAAAKPTGVNESIPDGDTHHNGSSVVEGQAAAPVISHRDRLKSNPDPRQSDDLGQPKQDALLPGVVRNLTMMAHDKQGNDDSHPNMTQSNQQIERLRVRNETARRPHGTTAGRHHEQQPRSAKVALEQAVFLANHANKGASHADIAHGADADNLGGREPLKDSLVQGLDAAGSHGRPLARGDRNAAQGAKGRAG
eukprot:TRINITY_DN28038_c0_g1_i1.p1 TRINITY_DN28038_c0_g1~~TRINITY_DN28038_c0_g1_i1.p1  ORF type:complete len:347 (-),score=45.88 TRINITY_DN28038_c0_g1_i1:17-1057(-)